MPRITVMGAGVCGLTVAMLLARDGHEVTVLERDPDPVPDTLGDAFTAWERGGVAQFRQAHYVHPRGREVLDDCLPDVRDALAAAGALQFDTLGGMPPTIADRTPRPGDERFATITARRPTFEWVLARAAQAEPGVEIRRGVGVEALTARDYDGTPHVTGVRTDGGEEIPGDLLVDAGGRRSPLPRLLEAVGARPPIEEAEDSGFIYYTRFFRSRDGQRPEYRAAPLTPMPSFSVLTLPGDNVTWSVTLYISAGDRPLKVLRHAHNWDAVVAACPRHAHWADGEPLTGVLPMGGVVDRYRRLVVDGEPVATGVLMVGDAWACTNPSLGRGITFALMHARRLRDFVRYHLEHRLEMAEVWDTVTEVEMTPWYRATVAEDRGRRAAIEADRAGAPPPPLPDEGDAAVLARLPRAALADPDMFRAFLSIRSCLTLPEEVLARPGLAERVLELAADAPAPPVMGPDRAQLLALLN
jgi:2-polyprenyl-6-methoxyphenol hydroxylase-like FAD-dependent oxidoreductase